MRNLKHLDLFENFSINEYYDKLQGYTMLGNADVQGKSGFVVGDKVMYDFKNTNTGAVVQSMPGEVVEVYTDESGNFVVVMKSESGTSWIFGTDDNKFHNLKDLRKI